MLAQFFWSGAAEEPVAIVDLINDETGLEDNHMGDHRIVGRIRIFGDVEIFLDDTPRVREEGPVSTDTAAIFVRLSDVVRTDRDKPAIANLHLTMEFKKPFSLSAVLGQKPPRLRTRTMGCWPCRSESFRRFAV